MKKTVSFLILIFNFASSLFNGEDAIQLRHFFVESVLFLAAFLSSPLAILLLGLIVITHANHSPLYGFPIVQAGIILGNDSNGRSTSYAHIRFETHGADQMAI